MSDAVSRHKDQRSFPWLSQPSGHALPTVCPAGCAITWLMVPSPGADGPAGRVWGPLSWGKPGQQGRKVCFVVMLLVPGASGKGSGWFAAAGTAWLRLAEALLSVAALLPTEQGAGTAPALTDALLHVGMNLLVLALALRESSHFTCRDGALGWAFLPLHHPLSVLEPCQGNGPSWRD